MKNQSLGIYIILILTLSSIPIVSASLPSKSLDNIDQGNITLFMQNYSEIDNIPNNVFIAKFTDNNAFFDRLFLSVHGTQNSKMIFENKSQWLTYTTRRESSPSLSGLFPPGGTIFDFGISRYLGFSLKFSERYNFCKDTSVPISQCFGIPRQTGSLYISNLVPMVKSTLQLSMNIKTDSPDSFIEIIGPGSKIIIKQIDNTIILNSYYRNSSGVLDSKIISLDNASEISTFNIIFDGYNKTNTIYINNGNHITTPFYSLDRQNLPYVDFSNGYIKITNYLMGKGTYVDINIFQITQTADRKFITAIGNKNMTAFGFDGPPQRNKVEKGINLLESKGDRGTIWVTSKTIEGYNDTYVEYIRNLIANNSWDLGIHYSEELEDLPLEQAYKLMEQEYSYVYKKFGQKPTSWCSLRNDDNVTHAIFAYKNLGMIWRNGDSGINAETDAGNGNLYDDNWVWWEPVSKAGMSYPVFTHSTDQDPAIKWSISFSKFETWVNNYKSNNISIVSFYEYWQINRNTYFAHFDNIEYSEDIVAFNATTNGANALINVNISSENDTKIFDNTSRRFLDYTVEPDRSITFWVENGHNYKINI